MEILDVRGLSCPLPVLKVKKSLDKGATDLRVIGSAQVAFENVTRFARSQGLEVNVLSHSPHEWEIELKRTGR
ncbi:MAG TPA: SirA family protein [Syntrophothermus lipocalidus]|uniref:SirA family protein n=1 Tax=Syntrophothermus lipocalidus (strain DSM 12680 / TGB-C1) TaxID=643648 RepID=D7CIH4_SYNLT|nr:sulfurtransferase TusA family protein [Syntrophothermus lipocalidus]ADI00839.1 SirA family protein [Syntrophothermus lipocalidus DSM 12680]HHV76562.1 SirA family protein [Syntrophothermus lipocalidus]HOV43149.1 sulfurtransferase TusA family protein [Syntrophothermus lipocalidus]